MFESFSEYDVFNNIRAQKAFISSFGIHIKAGLTSGSFFASSIRKKIISSSEKTILLAESSKFGKIEWAHFADVKEVDIIITDTGISNDYINFFNELEIPIIIV
ncbi:Deoxyribose operon repressor [subsurface metagenome]